jgi:hypothetical protein
MGENAIVEIVRRLAAGGTPSDLRDARRRLPIGAKREPRRPSSRRHPS